MKRGLHILLVLCLTGLFSCIGENTEAPAELIEVGNAVPDFSVLSSTGAEVDFKFSDFEKKKTLIVFFVTTCKDCQRELPKIQDAWDLLKSEGLGLILIARGQDAETVAQYWAQEGYDMPWCVDPDRSAYSKFALSTVPRLYLVGDNGCVAWKAVEDLHMKDGAELAAKITEKVGPLAVDMTAQEFITEIKTQLEI